MAQHEPKLDLTKRQARMRDAVLRFARVYAQLPQPVRRVAWLPLTVGFFLQMKRRARDFMSDFQAAGGADGHTNKTLWRMASSITGRFSDQLWLFGATPEQVRRRVNLDSEGLRDVVARCHDKNRPVLLAATHTGNPYVGLVAIKLAGIDIVGGAAGLPVRRSPTAAALMMHTMKRFGVEMIWLDGLLKGAEAADRCGDALLTGKVVAMAADDHTTRRRGSFGISASVFEFPIVLPPGPARLAIKTNAIIVPVGVGSIGNTVTGVLGTPIDALSILDGLGPYAAVAKLTHAIAKGLETPLADLRHDWGPLTGHFFPQRLSERGDLVQRLYQGRGDERVVLPEAGSPAEVGLEMVLPDPASVGVEL